MSDSDQKTSTESGMGSNPEGFKTRLRRKQLKRRPLERWRARLTKLLLLYLGVGVGVGYSPEEVADFALSHQAVADAILRKLAAHSQVVESTSSGPSVKPSGHSPFQLLSSSSQPGQGS